MANKKTENIDEKVDIVEEAVEETAETKPEVNNGPKKVKIKLPLTRSEKDDKYVAVNGKSYLIKRGVEVEVPAFVAEVLQHEEEMLSVRFAFEEASKSKE